jgi:acetyltransferase
VDYPISWERTAHTLDGTEYHIRPIKADDEQLEREFIVGLSPESRYKRMMCAMREPSPELVRRFVNVDYHRDMAFVAIVAAAASEGVPPTPHIIGVARYAADPEGAGGEFAVAVTDAWQSRGVGATLMQILLEYARAQGIHDLHGEILSTNSRMVELARYLGMRTHLSENDPAIVEASRDL